MIFRNCYTKFHKPLGEWNLRQFWNITSGVYAKQRVQIMLLFVYTTSRKSYLISTCRYFKLSWNPTVLSQLNCRNFSCSSITFITSSQEKQDCILPHFCLFSIKRVPWNCQNNLSKMVSLISDWWKSQECSSSLIHMARLMINHSNHILIVIHLNFCNEH